MSTVRRPWCAEVNAAVMPALPFAVSVFAAIGHHSFHGDRAAQLVQVEANSRPNSRGRVHQAGLRWCGEHHGCAGR